MMFFTFRSDMKLHDTKRQVTTQKNKNDIETWLNQFRNIHILRMKPNKQMGRFQNNPSMGWLHPKFTHAHPLAWAGQ